DALDEECEELRGQLVESEERQLDLHNQLQQTTEDKEQVQAQFAEQQDLCLELQKEKRTLETYTCELKSSVAELKEYVTALRERERLLVAFPELSPVTLDQPKSTGSVLLDMEQQLQANSIRTKILEQENSTLYSSLLKLKHRAQNKQSSSAAELEHDNRAREASGVESGLLSAGSEDRVSTASPSSLQLHLQTLRLNTDAAKSHAKTRRAFLLSRSRSSNQRKYNK
uniref:Uncharacterized protein n=1 Tax=Gasterosteus aculeatus TaxID=69293 RepID=G3PDU2_GASAC